MRAIKSKIKTEMSNFLFFESDSGVSVLIFVYKSLPEAHANERLSSLSYNEL